MAQQVKNPPAVQETQEIQVQSLGQEDPLEEMATHSSIPACKIPWTNEPGRLQSMGSQSRTQLSDEYFQLSVNNTSLVAQMVKNLPAIRETWVQSLGWEDPSRREWLPAPVFVSGEFHGQRSLDGLPGLQRVGLSDQYFHFQVNNTNKVTCRTKHE